MQELHHAANEARHFEEELADVVIMACSIAGLELIDLGEAVERKRLYNITRSDRHE